jgi:hypothetical protein
VGRRAAALTTRGRTIRGTDAADKPERNTHDTAFAGVAILGDRKRRGRGGRSHGCCDCSGRRDTRHTDADTDLHKHRSHRRVVADADRQRDCSPSDAVRRHCKSQARSIGKDRFQSELHPVRRSGADAGQADGVDG